MPAAAPSPPPPRRANLLISQDNPYDAGDDEVRIRYWIDNASDVMATGVELSFGKRDGTKIGAPATQPVLNPRTNMIGQVTIARSLYDATADPRLILSWTDDEGPHTEQRDPGALPPRRTS